MSYFHETGTGSSKLIMLVMLQSGRYRVKTCAYLCHANEINLTIGIFRINGFSKFGDGECIMLKGVFLSRVPQTLNQFSV